MEANSVPIVSNVQQHRRTYQICWDKADFVLYYSLTGEALQRIEIPKYVLFQSGNGEAHIELYYNNIVQALCSVSMPRIPHSALKPFWNAQLDQLTSQSIGTHELWKSLGKPRSGSINDARLRIKCEYKCAITRAAVEFENSHMDETAEYFAHKDLHNF